jgi:predicted NBD/HSP70 family sugar kinase
MTSGLTVGIDVGGTKTACVVTDADDRMLMHEVEPTEPDRLTSQLSALVQRAVNQLADSDPRSIEAVGVAVPGRVEPRTGSVGLAVNLGGGDIALGPLLEASVGLPCYIEHDARAAATWLHSANGSDTTTASNEDMAYLSVGTGISAGIVLDGRVLRGANGLAGEVGHIIADPHAGRCACGSKGCAEVIAAGPAIGRLAREAAAAGRNTTLTPDATAADVFGAASAGDEVATEIAGHIAESLARVVRGLALTLGVRHIVVGGGVAAAGDALLVRLHEAIARERQASPLVEAAFAEATIELLSPNVEAGARGAAVIARRRIQAEQREGVGAR